MHFSHPTSASYATHLETGILLLPKATLFCTPLRVNKIFLWSMVQWLPPKILLFLLESLKKKSLTSLPHYIQPLKYLMTASTPSTSFLFPPLFPNRPLNSFFSIFSYTVPLFLSLGRVLWGVLPHGPLSRRIDVRKTRVLILHLLCR